MKNIITFLLLILITHICDAQINILPKIGASPEVAMLDKFKSINISPYTGVPNLSIPLYSIKVDGVEIPVVLSYNSSGIHVGEEATWVGLGWNLSVGGNITQTPIGESDQTDFLTTAEYDKLINNASSGFNSFSGRSEIGYVWQQCVESYPGDDSYGVFNNLKILELGKPDNYSYAIPGGSGKFYLDPKTKLPVLFGSKKEHTFITKATSPLNQWIINDLNGTKYVFNQSDLEYADIFPRKSSFGNNWLGSQTWWLSNMLLSSGKQINFTYTDDNSYTSSQSQTYNRNYLVSDINYSTNTSNSQVINYSKKLSLIDTDNEQIVFELSTTKAERYDLKEGVTNGIPKRLNAIHIWDKIQHKKIKMFKFNYDYFNGICPNGVLSYDCARLKLISIKEIGYTSSGAEDLSKPPYQFQYNETNPLPSKQSYAVDFWGYYNGQVSNTGVLPKLPEAVVLGLISNNNYPLEVVSDFYNKGNANRGMDPTYATSGLINKITYPSGGYLQLNYEPNEFSNYPIFSAADINRTQGINLYKYIEVHDYKTCGIEGEAIKTSDIFYPRKDGTLILINFKCAFNIIFASAPDFNAAHENSKYGKAYISLKRIDASGNNTVVETWKVLNYTTFAIGHPDTLNVSKITYKFSPTDKYYFECSLGADVPCHNGMPGNGSVSVSCSVFDPNVTIPSYKSVGGGVRIASQETYNPDKTLALKRNYSYVNTDGTTSGKLMSPLRFYSFNPVINKSEGQPYTIFEGAYTFAISSNSYTPLSSDANGAMVGYSRVEVSDVDFLKNTNGKTIYYYRNTPSTPGKAELGTPDLPYEDNGLEDSIQTRNSKNELVMKTINTYGSIENKYAYGVTVLDKYIGPDICNSGNYYKFYNRWNVSYYPLQTRWYTLTNSTEYLYSPSGSPVLTQKQMSYNGLGQSISESNVRSDGVKITTNSVYPNDVANPNTLVQSMKTKNLYDLLLNQKQLKNDNSEIWNKEWVYNPTGSTNIKVTTFNQSNFGGIPYTVISDVLYDAKDNVIQAKSNEIFTTYIWSYNYEYPIAEIKNATYADVKKALGYDDTQIASLATNSAPAVSSIRNLLTTYFKNLPVLIKTYTYNPMIGMSTETNPNGVVTYYNYDSFNLLKNIRDNTSNLIKTFDYHYKQ